MSSVASATCSSLSADDYPFNLCGFTFPVRTSSHETQKWFDYGLFQCLNFNHYEGVICFEHALKHDPNCAMAHWGVAYGVGVNYNKVALLSEDETAKGFAASREAFRLAQCENEILLCRAMLSRYGDVPFKDMSTEVHSRQNSEYVRLMKLAYDFSVTNNSVTPQKGSYPFFIGVSMLYAEGLMQTKPWNLWKENMEETMTAKSVLEQGLALCPLHPGLCHMYVHLMEMSPFPQVAIPQSDVLRSTWKDFGHLLHMASHIDMLVGRYADAVQCNQLGIEADLRLCELRGSATFYQGYLLHNYHMKAWACMYNGQYVEAMNAANDMKEKTPRALLDSYVHLVEPYLSTNWHVLIRFGKWKEILTETLSVDPVFLVAISTGLYAKGLAHAALGDIVQAELMLNQFGESLKAENMGVRQLHNVKSLDSFAVAKRMLEGEILFRKWTLSTDKQRHVSILEQSLECLREAVVLDDNLPYDEPWGWMVPTRHALAALLVEAFDLGCSNSSKGGILTEAEEVYRKDLTMHPKNIWSLRGLQNCLLRHNNHIIHGIEISFLDGAANQASKDSDICIGASCLCALEQQKLFVSKVNGTCSACTE
jgi:tetratricopeptide (TPR) repeat protein